MIINYSHQPAHANTKRFGFTLAEVLITLGVIGVVAAMTIPTLISNYQKHVIESNLKETYSILQQVMRSNEGNDNAFDPEVLDGTDSLEKWFNSYMKPYLKFSHLCINKSGCWHKGVTKTLGGGTAPYDMKDMGVGINTITIKLYNGANLCLDSYGVSDLWNIHGIKSTSLGLVVLIDANGDSGPNIIGKDIHPVAFTEKGLIPDGADSGSESINNNCNIDSTAQNSGYYCLERIKNNGWEIPNDVWKKKI